MDFLVTSISQDHPVQRHHLASLQGTHLPPTLLHLPLRGPIAMGGPMERGPRQCGPLAHRPGVALYSFTVGFE